MRAASRMRGYAPPTCPPSRVGKVRYVGRGGRGRGRREPLRRRGRRRADRRRLRAAAAVVDAEAALAGAARALSTRRPGPTSSSPRTFAQGDAEAALRRARPSWSATASASIATPASPWRTARASPSGERGRGRRSPLWSSTQVPGIAARPARRPARPARRTRPRRRRRRRRRLRRQERCSIPRRSRSRRWPGALGRPVKWVGDRREDLLTSTQAWDEVIDAELGVDGRRRDRRAPRAGGRRPRRVLDLSLDGQHRGHPGRQLPARALPRARTTAARAWAWPPTRRRWGRTAGVGRPVSAFVTEALLDRAARAPGPRSGRDPPPQPDPARGASVSLPVGHRVGQRRASRSRWTRACDEADYAALRAEQAAARAARPPRRHRASPRTWS